MSVLKWARQGLLIILLGFVPLIHSSTSEAQIGIRTFRVWHGHFGHSWGWFNPWFWQRPVVAIPLGVSYWRYWNYQPRYASYGAISYSPEQDVFAYSWGYRHKGHAVRDSITQCGHQDCTGVVWVQGGCAAVASIQGGEHMGWAHHPRRLQAREGALRGCERSQGTAQGCDIRAWVCSH